MIINFDNPDVYSLLLTVGKKYGIDPSVPLESEDFFRQLLERYSGTLNLVELEQWLHQQIQQSFAALNEYPKWVQNPEWPFDGMKPMIFVGQIDVTVSKSSTASQVLHDNTSYYLFISQKGGLPKIIVQQY